MGKPRRWRRIRLRWEDGGAGVPSSPLSGAGTLLRIMPPLLLLTLGGAAVAVLFSRSPSFPGGGPPHFPPMADFVVEKTQVAVAAPMSTMASSFASPKRVMRSNNTTPMPCDWKEGHGDAERRRRWQQKRVNIWTTVEDDGRGPYHDWELLRSDMEEMMESLKIYVYPDARYASSAFAGVFLPQADPSNPRLGNYHSEHMFKHALLRSPLLSPQPRQAQLFFLPISINALRNHPRVRSEAAIADFVARYVDRLKRELPFWNASSGADHFYVSCHSIGRDAAARHRELRDNALHVSCSASYFQRNYVAHKDVALPQVWPRPPQRSLNPPGARKQLVFFAGRIQNSQVRAELILRWENDSSMDIFSRNPPFSYEEGFRRSRYCLHVKGYEVNTARISDAIHYGCIPVILSNYYDPPFANLLDWRKFSVIVNHRDIGFLKEILLSIPNATYFTMYQNLVQVRKHFRWHMTPKLYDAFYMTVYQLWLERSSYLGFVS